MAVKANAADAAKAWETNFAASGTKYVKGTAAVKTAPGQLAAAQQDVWAQNTVAAKARFAAKVAAVPLGSWQNSCATVGAQNLATGATKGAPKQQAFMQKFIPQLSNVVESLPARGSYEQNKQKAMAYMDQLHALKGQFS